MASEKHTCLLCMEILKIIVKLFRSRFIVLYFSFVHELLTIISLKQRKTPEKWKQKTTSTYIHFKPQQFRYYLVQRDLSITITKSWISTIFDEQVHHSTDIWPEYAALCSDDTLPDLVWAFASAPCSGATDTPLHGHCGWHNAIKKEKSWQQINHNSHG